MKDKEQTISNLRKLKSFHSGSYGADIDKAIEAIEQEPCEDCVSRQAVLNILDDMVKDYIKENDFDKAQGCCVGKGTEIATCHTTAKRRALDRSSRWQMDIRQVL